MMSSGASNNKSCSWETEFKEVAENGIRYFNEFLLFIEDGSNHNQLLLNGSAGSTTESSRIAQNAISGFRELSELLNDHDQGTSAEEMMKPGRRPNFKKKNIKVGPLPSSDHQGINPKEMLDYSSSSSCRSELLMLDRYSSACTNNSTIHEHDLVMNGTGRVVPDHDSRILNTTASSHHKKLSHGQEDPLRPAAGNFTNKRMQGAAGKQIKVRERGGFVYSPTEILACLVDHCSSSSCSMLSNSKMKCGSSIVSSTKASPAGGCNCSVKRLVTQTIRVPAISNKEADIPVDDYSWRKYGQKPIKGSSHPRSYYRCTVAKDCPARKHVERCMKDPTMLLVTYKGEHNHLRFTVPYPSSIMHV